VAPPEDENGTESDGHAPMTALSSQSRPVKISPLETVAALAALSGVTAAAIASPAEAVDVAARHLSHLRE
jgi:hypothetical protein